LDAKGQAPAGVFPTVESFTGDGGDLEKPEALLQNEKPLTKASASHQGQEALGALQFKPTSLKPGESTVFLLFLGIDKEGRTDHTDLLKKYGSQDAMCKVTADTQRFWKQNADRIQFETGDANFNNWMMWVKTQPTLRKLFGNSFLPDFDYGRGGRGWRDLWQDCLALLLFDPSQVRQDMLNNFGGVRADGSNATIIVRKEKGVEFIADRNNISRVWMDHGLWPFFTTQLYLHQTGDWAFLKQEAPYFDVADSKGTVAEHLLLQTVAPFFDVGDHNNIRLLDADWNDGLDMALDKGESVAFTSFFAGNLNNLADILERSGEKEMWVANEILPLFDTLSDPADYDSASDKRKRRDLFRAAVKNGFRGQKTPVAIARLCTDLRAKASWIKDHLNTNEWIDRGGSGWFNGYYDNKGRRVEGPAAGSAVRMTLTGQVFPIMAGIADEARTRAISQSVNKILFDKELGGIRLNTDFGGPQPALGRAFSFSYGDKENGAVFSHMVVMYANALYRRGFAAEGHAALSSLYKMATNTAKSRIFPGLPEYFNGSGCGLYCYLTGSASWYVYTLLTQVFGVRGEAGDLLIEPKLAPEQFDAKGQASVEFFFAGSRVKVRFRNTKKRSYSDWRLGSVVCDKQEVSPVRRGEKEILISRRFISQSKTREIDVELA
jgi:cellobiose phosphorylase